MACVQIWVSVLPGPGLWPQFVFSGPGPQVVLLAPALKLYLPALAT